jgi:hypothetical protein
VADKAAKEISKHWRYKRERRQIPEPLSRGRDSKLYVNVDTAGFSGGE